MPSSPLDYSCSHQFDDLTNCGASAGEACRGESGAPLEIFHVERLNAVAAQAAEAGEPVSKEEFDRAVYGTGRL